MSNPLSASAQVVNTTVSMVESFWAPFLNVSNFAFVVGLWVLTYAINILLHWDQSSSECTGATGWCNKTLTTVGTLIETIITLTVVILFGVLLGNGLSRYGVKPQAFTQALGVLAFFYLLYLIFIKWSTVLDVAMPATGSFGDVTKAQVKTVIEAYSTDVVAGYEPYWIVLVAFLLVVARAVA